MSSFSAISGVRGLMASATVLLAIAGGVTAWADDGMQGMAGSGHSMKDMGDMKGMSGMQGMDDMKGMSMEEHAKHRATMAQEVQDGVKRSMIDVHVSGIPMVRQDGHKTTLAKVLAGNEPTVVAFIYTSCTTICPVTSQILSATQDALGPELKGVRMVSVSIDPEYDTPERLTAYAKKFNAQPQWQHYGGTLADSVAVQKAFNAFRGDKMNHVSLIFINGGGKKHWLQLEGFPTADEMVKAIHEQMRS